jgi:hypothetical protein
LEEGLNKREANVLAGIKNVNVQLEEGLNKRDANVLAGIKNVNVQLEEGLNKRDANVLAGINIGFSFIESILQLDIYILDTS